VDWGDIREGDIVDCMVPARGIVTAIAPHHTYSGMRTYTLTIIDTDQSDLTYNAGGLVRVNRWGRQPR
jgi:hypothetical protein